MIGRRGFLSFLGSMGAAVTIVEEAKASGALAAVRSAIEFPPIHCPECGWQISHFDAYPEARELTGAARVAVMREPRVMRCPNDRCAEPIVVVGVREHQRAPR